MTIKRYLKGVLGVHYMHWAKWPSISFDRYWSGRLLHLNLGKICVTLDCRSNWLEDMITGKPA